MRIEVPVDEIGIEELGCCIAERVASFRFPEPEGGGVVVVTYPFLLKATP